jgi:MFS family permease
MAIHSFPGNNGRNSQPRGEDGVTATMEKDDGQTGLARREWARAPLLPFAGLVGHATAVFHINGFSPFIVPISEDFGWSRTLTTMGLTLILLMQAASSIPIGYLVDRIGSRKLALVGMISSPLGFALLGTATGSESNWLLLWLIMGMVTMPVQSTIWTAAISNAFKASRGMALGVSMCGTSLAAALFPWLGAILIQNFGWQKAMLYESLIWIALTYPFMFIFFRTSRDKELAGDRDLRVAADTGMTLKQGLRSSVFWRMLIVGASYTFVIPTMIINFIPIQTDGGVDPVRAASIAAVIGLASLVGRLTSGYLVDRISAVKVGAVAFLTPALGCAVLLFYGITPATAIFTGMMLGLAQGAELDVFGYLTSRYFGTRYFGSLFGCILLSLTLGSGLGHVGASMIFDATGSYSAFMWVTAIVSLLCSLCFLTMPRPGLLPQARAS